MADFNNEDTQVEATQDVQPEVSTETEQAQAPVAEAPKAVVTDEIATSFGATKTFQLKDKDGNVLRDYHFQFPGVEAGLKIIALAQNDITEYRKQLLKQLVSDPQVRSQGLEWFDTHKGLFEVLGELDTFLGEMLDGVRG